MLSNYILYGIKCIYLSPTADLNTFLGGILNTATLIGTETRFFSEVSRDTNTRTDPELGEAWLTLK